jgi:hypothetical protein
MEESSALLHWHRAVQDCSSQHTADRNTRNNLCACPSIASLWLAENRAVFGGDEMIGGGCFHYIVQPRQGEAPRDAGSRG